MSRRTQIGLLLSTGTTHLLAKVTVFSWEIQGSQSIGANARDSKTSNFMGQAKAYAPAITISYIGLAIVNGDNLVNAINNSGLSPISAGWADGNQAFVGIWWGKHVALWMLRQGSSSLSAVSVIRI